jgi:tRNA wybutosine-synthesizing protein 3
MSIESRSYTIEDKDSDASPTMVCSSLPHFHVCATMPPSKTPLPQSFLTKKKIILDQLSVPVSEYDDLSPKGSIDVGIRDLIDEINQFEGCVTTSSCSGRVSVFLEGKKQDDWDKLDTQVEEDNESGRGRSRQYEGQDVRNEKVRETTAGVGGKGGGGKWLFVTHNAIDVKQYESDGCLSKLLGMEGRHDGLSQGGRRFIHFKFEPMVGAKP